MAMGNESHIEYNPIEIIPGALPNGKTTMIKIPMMDNSWISFFEEKINIINEKKRHSPIKKYNSKGSLILSVTISPVKANKKTKGSSCMINF